MARRMTYSNVVSTLALFGVLAGGGAWAASKIGSSDIRKNAIGARHVAKNAITTKKIRDGAVTEAKLAAGLGGQTGPAGPIGPAGPAGSARAYGLVDDQTAAVTRSKGSPTASRVGEGRYCVSVPGISSSEAPMFVAVASDLDHYPGPFSINFELASGEEDLNGDGSETAYAMWSPDPSFASCAAGQFEVLTWSTFSGPDSFDDVGYFADGSYDDQNFVFLVP